MSRPANILDVYRSYNYHHILIACDSSETAQILADQSEITLFDHEDVTSDDRSRFHVQTVPGTGGANAAEPGNPDTELIGRGNNNYIVLINGTSDTHFSIQSARWQSVTTPTGEGGFDSTTLEGQMTIQEPKGARFLNVLAHAASDLGVSPMGMVFMLKTIFVGHTHAGSTEMITTVKPLLMTMIDIQTEFDVTGATYTIAFVGNVGGASKMPQVSSVSDGFSFEIRGTDQNLQQTMRRLQNKLNNLNEDTKNKLKEDALCAGVDLDFDDSFIPVEYRIRLDPAYQKMKAGTATREQQENTGQQDPVIVQEGDSLSIENLIKHIMLSSQEVIDEGNPDEGDEKFVHKISASVDPGKESYVVTYNVHRYSVHFPGRDDQQSDDSLFSFEPQEGERIIFDYIFTGRNVDILDFNMKMEMGLAFLQTLSATPSLMSASEIQNSNQEGSTTAKSADPIWAAGTRKPLFLGMKLKDPMLRNHITPGEVNSYNSLLSRWAGYETLEASLTIRGNPQLLHETTPTPDDVRIDEEEPIQEAGNLLEGQQERGFSPEVLTSDEAERLLDIDEQPESIMPLMWQRPGFVKVNVRFPTVTTQFGQDALTEPFWYTGYFYIISVDNIFEEGQFRQELDIMSLPSNVGNITSLGKKCDVEQPSESSGGDGSTSVSSEEANQEEKSTKDADAERNSSTDVGVIFPIGGA